jgi:clan AA aspartic protease
MIIGVVNARLEVTIRFPILDATGQQVDQEATVDTGFSGWLTLPHTLIIALGLTWHALRTVTLADGSRVQVDTYKVTVLWDNTPRSIDVYDVDSDPLVGMKMLNGHELRAEIKVGSSVTITALP